MLRFILLFIRGAGDVICPGTFAGEEQGKTEYAPVMELVDMRDLGSRAATRVGSSPFRRTITGHQF